MRAAALVAGTVIAYTVVLVLSWRARLFYVRKDGRPDVFRVWARFAAWTMGISIHADGPVPEPPCLVVANHLSYLDIIVLGSFVPAVFVAKSDVAQWPVAGVMCRAAGTLFIDRADRWRLPTVLGNIARVLDTGGAVVVFPEGTSSDGRRVLPFNSSTLEPVAACGHRLYFAALVYDTPGGLLPPELTVCWWGDMTLVDHLWRLLTLPAVSARLRFGIDPGGESDRRALAKRLHHSVGTAHAELKAETGLARVPQSSAGSPDYS